jgi:hypothetical protein
MKANGKRQQAWLPFNEAVTEIAQALNIKDKAAVMTLYGLVATGNVGAIDIQLEIIDAEKYKITEFEGSIAFVSANDVRHWLGEWSQADDHVVETIASEID